MFDVSPGPASNEEGEVEDKMRACDSLIMCIITSLNQGLRNGGGIGDVLRKPGKNVSRFGGFVQGDNLKKCSVFELICVI